MLFVTLRMKIMYTQYLWNSLRYIGETRYKDKAWSNNVQRLGYNREQHIFSFFFSPPLAPPQHLFLRLCEIQECDRFLKQKTIKECVTLSYRLYELQRGEFSISTFRNVLLRSGCTLFKASHCVIATLLYCSNKNEMENVKSLKA